MDIKAIQAGINQLVAKLPELSPEVQRATELLILSLRALILNAPDPGDMMIRYTQDKWVALAKLLSRS